MQRTPTVQATMTILSLEDSIAIGLTFVCPITLGLPLDPVTAEDGVVYDRKAIERYFLGKQVITSPITRAIMGTELLPAVRHKKGIDAMVDEGIISGELASDWKAKKKQDKRMNELLAKAEDGDTRAMEQLAENYRNGWNGFKRDPDQALHWLTMTGDALERELSVLRARYSS